MKIAIVLPTIISKNGTAKQAIELAIQLEKLGNKVTFVTFAYNKDSSFPEFKKFSVTFCVDVQNTFLYKHITKNVSKLEKIFLHIALLNIPKVIRILNEGNYEVLNPHDWFGLWVSKLAKKRKIIANINDVPERNISNFVSKLKLFIDRFRVERVSRVIVLDNNNKKKVVKWLQIPEEKVIVIRSGIDTVKYKSFRGKLNLRKKYKLQQDCFIVICANMLAPNRKYEEVIKAISNLNDPKIYLFILSKLDFNPTYAKFLKNLVEREKLSSNVHIIDKVFTDEERMGYIAGGDVLIFSNYPQTWGLTAIEAMALSVPVVISKGAGVSEVIKHGHTGILYPIGDIKKLSKIIRELSIKKYLLKRLGLEGKKFVLNSFSWEKFGREIQNIFYV